ncbi:hypothetical protein Hamer_G000716 [Homarus americanus]|uniref:Uncharacterized protein n=1 Tax=Homarus americanus TaxID=6706 RepID=A0A8J5N257_HOMAM|nr:hypothetical protein Hamer_G000716 [Homarus americanus]
MDVYPRGLATERSRCLGYIRASRHLEPSQQSPIPVQSSNRTHFTEVYTIIAKMKTSVCVLLAMVVVVTAQINYDILRNLSQNEIQQLTSPAGLDALIFCTKNKIFSPTKDCSAKMIGLLRVLPELVANGCNGCTTEEKSKFQQIVQETFTTHNQKATVLRELWSV